MSPPSGIKTPPKDQDHLMETEYENRLNSHPQISSLVTSAPDFLASLPSFRPQSPPFDQAIGTRSQASSPTLEVKPIELLSRIDSIPLSYPNVYPSGNVSTVSLPNFQSHLNVSEEFPCMMKRSSSVCDSTADHKLPRNPPVQTCQSFDAVPSEEFGCSNLSVNLDLSSSPIEDVMSSPSKSLPVFSGFAHMSAEESNKQFFF